MRHLIIAEIILTLYGFVNLSVTYINHKPVYNILTFDSVFSWGLAFCLPLMDAIFHVLFFLITKWRTGKYHKEVEEEILKEVDDESDMTPRKIFNDSIVLDDESKDLKGKLINASTT